MKKVSSVEDEVFLFTQSVVEVLFKEKRDFDFVLDVASKAVKELRLDNQPIIKALFLQLQFFRVCHAKVESYKAKKAVTKTQLLDIRTKNDDLNLKLTEMDNNTTKTNNKVESFMRESKELEQIHEKIDSDLRLQLLCKESKEKELSNCNKEVTAIISSLNAENEVALSKLAQNEKEHASMNIGLLLDEIRDMSLEKHRLINDSERYAALNEIKAKELEIVKADIERFQKELVTTKAKNDARIEAIAQITEKIIEDRIVFDKVNSHNTSSTKKNEDLFSTMTSQLREIHELTKLEPLVRIELAQTKEDFARRISSLVAKKNDSEILLKIAEVVISIENLQDNEETTLKNQIADINAKNVTVSELEKTIAELSSEIEMLENDIVEKEKVLDETSSSKNESDENNERSETDLQKVEDGVKKKLKLDLSHMQADYEKKSEGIQKNIDAIKGRKIVCLEKGAHVKEKERLQKEINEMKIKLKNKLVEKERNDEIEVESKRKKAVKKDDLPPPDTRMRSTPLTTANTTTKKPLPILKQSSPAQSHVSDQSDNMFEDLVSNTFKIAKPGVRFQSQASQKEPVAVKSLSQQNSQSANVDDGYSDDEVDEDEDEMDEEEDDDDSEYVAEELSFIKAKSQQEPKVFASPRPVAPRYLNHTTILIILISLIFHYQRYSTSCTFSVCSLDCSKAREKESFWL